MLAHLVGHGHGLFQDVLGAARIYRQQQARQRQGAGGAGRAGGLDIDLSAQGLLPLAQRQHIVAAGRTDGRGDLAQFQFGDGAVQFRRQLSVIDPADITAGGGGGVLAELAGNHREGRALLELGDDLLGVLLDLGVLFRIVHRHEDFHHMVVRLVGAFGQARHFGIHHFGRHVHAVGIFVLHGLHPGDGGGDLGAQGVFAGAGRGQGGAQLGQGEAVVRHHAVDALVHFGGADGDLLLHRFLQLDLFVFQLVQDLALDALALLRGQLLVDARRGQVQGDALAHLIVGNGFVIHRGGNAVGVVGFRLGRFFVLGGIARHVAGGDGLVVLGFLHRGLAGCRRDGRGFRAGWRRDGGLGGGGGVCGAGRSDVFGGRRSILHLGCGTGRRLRGRIGGQGLLAGLGRDSRNRRLRQGGSAGADQHGGAQKQGGGNFHRHQISLATGILQPSPKPAHAP